jgi:predicted XRE-type DNA-binding protein
MTSPTSKISSSDLSVTVVSGNVFADLGLPNSEEMLVKAELSKQIYLRLQDRQMVDDGDLLSVEVDQVAALRAGKPSNLSIKQLFRVLNALDCDVEIIIKNKAINQEISRVKVTA